jgi:hypothetical protein
MIKEAVVSSGIVLFSCLSAHAFERIECMDRPDGSVYQMKSIADRPGSVDVRIYHGWQFGRHRLPGLPIGIENDFLNARYDTRTARDRQEAIAAFTPLERLIFNMDIVFHHQFDDCDVSDGNVNCRAYRPVRVGREWISDLEFFFRAREGTGDADTVYTVGIRGESTYSGIVFSSGRRYFQYGRYNQCLYLARDHW